VEGIYYCTYL